MKSNLKILIIIILFYGSISAKNNPTIIYSSIDLTQVVNDKVPVIINLNGIESKSIIYRFPKVVQGTYAISDFGRFVENLEAFDIKGNKLKVSKLDINSWEIKHAKKLHKITYLINDTYDLDAKMNKNIPQFPAGTNISDENYVLNTHGFIGYFDGLNTNKYTLNIKAPNDFSYATGLKLEASKKNTDGTTNYVFKAPRYFDLIDNPILFGKLDLEEFIINGVKIVLSVYSPNKVYNAKEMKGVIFEMLKSQLTYLKNFETTSRYDIQIYFADEVKIKPKDYGALEHHSSTVMVMPETMAKKELFYHFKNLLAHEFFHIITPLNIHSENIHDFNYNNPDFSKHLWLYEGVTEYFSRLFQIDQNLITEKEFYDEMFDKLKTSKKYNDSLSFTKMSKHILDKEYHKNYPNVYQKGSLIAMCLDILLREESNGTNGLLFLMKELSLTYGKDTPFVDDSFIDEISLMTNPIIDEFLKSHVVGDEPISYQDFLDKVGLTLTGDEIINNKNSTSVQEELKTSWLNLNTIAFENVNVISMVKDTILKNHRVIVSNGKIMSIEPTTNKHDYSIQKTINAKGKYLIPGLSEMHYHWRNEKDTPEDDFKLLIANGVTSVRNMAEEPVQKQKQVDIRNKLNTGEYFGPNYYTTGPYLKFKQLKTKTLIIDEVRKHKEKGYDFLKLADNLPKDLYLFLLEEANKKNVQVIGHAQRKLPLEFSLRMKSIEHVEEFLYIFNGEENYTYVNNNLDELNKIAKEIKNSGIYVTPTLVIFEKIPQYLDDLLFERMKKSNLTKYLSKEEREKYLTEKNDARADFKELIIDGVTAKDLFQRYITWMRKFTKVLYDNDVKLLTGSDTFGMAIVGFSIHREMEILQELGMKPFDILNVSTVNASRYLDSYPLEGTIAEGKNANLVLLNKNPLENIKNSQSIEGVMLHGKWFGRNQLDKMLLEVENTFK
tara:strand:- start:179 stop:3019 length:2841 start_codon:yes stop_codon:yes gene_type:complete